MSGKKRSEVREALNVAARAADKARGLLAEADARSLKSLGEAVDAGLARARGTAVGSIPSGLAGAEITVARSAAQAASETLDAAAAARAAAQASLNKASALDRGAAAAFEVAQQQLDAAQRSYDAKPSAHYMDREWQLATTAGQAFQTAQREARAAAQARARAIADAEAAVEAASNAAAAADRAATAVRTGVAAANDRKRREEAAHRIAEEARRRAATAVAAAAAAVAVVPADDAHRFLPSDFAALMSSLADAEAALGRGDSVAAEQAAQPVGRRAVELAATVARARAEFDRKRAEADAAVAGLASALEGADRGLVEQWSDQPGAFGAATGALAAARAALRADDFGATAAAAAATAALRAAMASAAEAREADHRRSEIATAIMDVLEEMQFEVSWEPGTRETPLSISGQTADPTARGDFDVHIPLDGEIDFEVRANAGDTACVAAIGQLQARLAERGVAWVTTDWGHAAEASARDGQSVVRERTRTETVTRTRTR